MAADSNELYTRLTGAGAAVLLVDDDVNILDTAKDINRYWRFDKGGMDLGTRTYDVTLAFLVGDVPAGANTNNFVIKRYDNGNGTWNDTAAG